MKLRFCWSPPRIAALLLRLSPRLLAALLANSARELQFALTQPLRCRAAGLAQKTRKQSELETSRNSNSRRRDEEQR